MADSLASDSAVGSDLATRYALVRAESRARCAGLSAEDCNLQSMPDASPLKWHLAHSTWFFETFVLARDPDYRPHDERFGELFNSYYNSVGPLYARPQRGLLTRPSLEDVSRYRAAVDEALLAQLEHDPDERLREIVCIGLHHEQQHQELMLTDLKHGFSCNPLLPTYRPADAPPGSADDAAPSLGWLAHDGGLCELGHDGVGFGFDNEFPRHRVWLEPFELADRLVSCGEYLDFIRDGGYQRHELWLADGWTAVQEHGWRAPLYWREDGERGWLIFTLHGERPLVAAEPICHLSYYEADAYARWAACRLPSEAEWEQVASRVEAIAAAPDPCHPAPIGGAAGFRQAFGSCWQWTSSAYACYPGYRPPAGALGEYNGKFMCGQQVLRGSSCATPAGHARASYRNFFHAPDRWQFSGLRLARDR